MAVCTVACYKYSLFLFNLVFIAGGVAVIAAGAILHTSGTSKLIATNVALSYSIVMIVIGSIVFLLAFFGCCGAMQDISWKLTLYAVLVILVLLVEIAGIAVAIGFHKKTETFIKDNLKNSLKHQAKGDAAMWDKIQTGFHCCGADGPSDYPGGKVATSCCAPGSKTCAVKDAYKTGCYQLLRKFVENNAVIFASVAGVVGVCQIIASFAAFSLASAIKNNAGYGGRPMPPPASNM